MTLPSLCRVEHIHEILVYFNFGDCRDEFCPPFACKIQDEDYDFIFSDEALFTRNPERLDRLVVKPDFDIELLRKSNYLCHLAVIKMDLFKKLNGFQMGFDGSQDHDLFLRLAETTSRIMHIPKVLYLWQTNPDSFSQTRIKKCIQSGKKAVKEHLIRCNINANISNIKNRPIYKIKYL